MSNPHRLRFLVSCICFVAGLIVLVILNLLLNGDIARILLGAVSDGNESKPEVFTVQHIIWLVFFVGFGELFLRFQWSRNEAQELRQGYLESNRDNILSSRELGEAYKKLRAAPEHLFLPRMLTRTIAQFQANRSIDQASSLLNSSMELFLHEIDLRYNMLRYIVWFIPTMGFIGTVVGISKALGRAGSL
ncbi:MAG: MotA/TolQ/ExbB proton channel family protein, partial [Verrucomicrobiota bacterium]